MSRFRQALYHGTIQRIGELILRDGFEAREDSKHWLGNGIYFFIDEELARWWAVCKPSTDYGSKWQSGDKAAVIKATVTIESNRVLDLRELKDFEKFSKWQGEFHEMVLKYIDNCQDLSDKDIMEIYRCALFDEIFDKKGIDLIVGCFSRLDHLNKDVREMLEKFDMAYAEVQVCVKNPNLINIVGMDVIEGDEYGKAI